MTTLNLMDWLWGTTHIQNGFLVVLILIGCGYGYCVSAISKQYIDFGWMREPRSLGIMGFQIRLWRVSFLVWIRDSSRPSRFIVAEETEVDRAWRKTTPSPSDGGTSQSS
jgi:hypothetical protein